MSRNKSLKWSFKGLTYKGGGLLGIPFNFSFLKKTHCASETIRVCLIKLSVELVAGVTDSL